jgi:flagellar motility protein MotE (MotC chaperone)
MPAPRILPLIGVAAAGVLALNALAGARSLPDLVQGARAYAEGLAKPKKGAAKDAGAATGNATDAAATGLPPLASPVPAAKAQPVCAPTAAELAKEAGLSPAELQVLQSLGERRGQLDQRENDLNTQLALMAAAEAKLDAKVSALNGLKADIQNLLNDADAKQNSEVDRLVKVFESMKPKDAGPRMMLLDDSVRLPIAAKMKDRALSAVLAQMPPAEAKKLTEALAARYNSAKQLAANAQATAAQAAAQTPAPAAPGAAGPAVTAETMGSPADKPAPKHKAPARQAHKAPARKAAPPSAEAAAAPAPGPAPAKAAAPAATAPAAPAPKAG